MYAFYRGPQARRMDTARTILKVEGRSSEKVAAMVNRNGEWKAYRVFLMGNGFLHSGDNQPRVNVTDIVDDPEAIMARLEENN